MTVNVRTSTKISTAVGSSSSGNSRSSGSGILGSEASGATSDAAAAAVAAAFFNRSSGSGSSTGGRRMVGGGGPEVAPPSYLTASSPRMRAAFRLLTSDPRLKQQTARVQSALRTATLRRREDEISRKLLPEALAERAYAQGALTALMTRDTALRSAFVKELLLLPQAQQQQQLGATSGTAATASSSSTAPPLPVIPLSPSSQLASPGAPQIASGLVQLSVAIADSTARLDRVDGDVRALQALLAETRVSIDSELERFTSSGSSGGSGVAAAALSMWGTTAAPLASIGSGSSGGADSRHLRGAYVSNNTPIGDRGGVIDGAGTRISSSAAAAGAAAHDTTSSSILFADASVPLVQTDSGASTAASASGQSPVPSSIYQQAPSSVPQPEPSFYQMTSTAAAAASSSPSEQDRTSRSSSSSSTRPVSVLTRPWEIPGSTASDGTTAAIPDSSADTRTTVALTALTHSSSDAQQLLSREAAEGDAVSRYMEGERRFVSSSTTASDDGFRRFDSYDDAVRSYYYASAPGDRAGVSGASFSGDQGEVEAYAGRARSSDTAQLTPELQLETKGSGEQLRSSSEDDSRDASDATSNNGSGGARSSYWGSRLLLQQQQRLHRGAALPSSGGGTNTAAGAVTDEYRWWM